MEERRPHCWTCESTGHWFKDIRNPEPQIKTSITEDVVGLEEGNPRCSEMESGGEEGDKNCIPSFHSSAGCPEQEAGILTENKESAGGPIAATAEAATASIAEPTTTAEAAATTSAVASTVATLKQER